MKSLFKGHRFPPEIISHAAWLYHRFTLSFRNVEDMLAERGITAPYEAIRYWCVKSGLTYARCLRFWRSQFITLSNMTGKVSSKVGDFGKLSWL